MGVSTDAIIAFGFDLGDELPQALLPEDDDESFDFEEWFLERAGITYPEGGDTAAYAAYWEARKEAIESCPIEIITHCSYDYPMYFLALRGTRATASRGGPKTVEIERIGDEAILKMCRFCESAGIDWTEPQWHLFSLWG